MLASSQTTGLRLRLWAFSFQTAKLQNENVAQGVWRRVWRRVWRHGVGPRSRRWRVGQRKRSCQAYQKMRDLLANIGVFAVCITSSIPKNERPLCEYWCFWCLHHVNGYEERVWRRGMNNRYEEQVWRKVWRTGMKKGMKNGMKNGYEDGSLKKTHPYMYIYINMYLRVFATIPLHDGNAHRGH